MYSLKLLLIALFSLSSSALSISNESQATVVQSTVKPKTLLLHGWLPFWAKASGTVEMLAHEEYFNTISPFSMEMNDDGTIFNRFASDKTVLSLIDKSRPHKYKVVPTIAWFDSEQIDQTLQNSTFRQLHVEEITRVVVKNNYDGIDIDYEGKYLKTRAAYSSFIEELGSSMHKNGKLLHCTVEARTPAEDIYYGYDGEVSRASDYKVLNKYCDSVKIMSYDQRDGDRTLVYNNSENFYRPVADPLWVEKTIKEAIYEIDRKKIIVGIPTYGNVYKHTKQGGKDTYAHVGAINYNNAILRAKEYNAVPTRNVAGELQFSYKKDDSTFYVSFTDAVSIKKKLLLAEKYGVNGVSLFKIDGGMDQAAWRELSKIIKI